MRTTLLTHSTALEARIRDEQRRLLNHALFHGLEAMLLAASIIAPLYAVWTVVEYRRVVRRLQPLSSREVAQ